MKRRVHIWVYGRVQGVFYRASARDKALAFGLLGWTRNLADGGVEIIAEGMGADIRAFIEWCGYGPRWARVDELKVIDETPTGEFADFEVRRDG